MITPSQFKTKFPEFSTIDDSIIQIQLDEAYLCINESFWGNKYDLGVYYYCAHILALSIQTQDNGSEGVSGPIVSDSVGDVSTSFASPAINNTNDAYFLQTSYGQRYLNLKKSLGIGAFTV